MNFNRRDLLAHGGNVALLVSTPFWGGSSCREMETASYPADENAALETRLGRPAIEALTLAARAPSGHNTQPWTVRIPDREQWVIGIAGSRRLAAVDGAGRETLLSLGAFLENLVVASTHHGYGVEYNLIAHSPADTEVLGLRLRNTRSSPQPLDRIRLRRTVRNGYLPNEIKTTDLAEITGHGGEFHYFPRGGPQAKYLSEGTVEANRQQAFREPAQEELADWIRWSSSDAAKYRNGLTPAGMEIVGPIGWYVSHFYDHASVLSRSFRDTTIGQVIERVGQGGGWLVVSSNGTDVAALIETGRKVQRMWLQLRERKIAIHPMTQMLEEVPWRDRVAQNLGIDGVPQFILRIGYVSSYPAPASLRMPPAWFVTAGS